MKNMFTKVKDLFGWPDEYEEEEIEDVQPQKEPEIRTRPVSVPTNHYSNKVLSLNPGAEKMDILNFTMTHYDMTGEVSDYIKKRKTVIVNMQKLDPKDIQRTVDYLTGTCYALNGTVEKIAESIFIFAPESVSISPETVKQKDMWHKI